MHLVTWRFSRACVALLAVLISAVGGFRLASELDSGVRGSVVAAVCGLNGCDDQKLAQRVATLHQSSIIHSTDTSAQSRDFTAMPRGSMCRIPTLLQGSAHGPRAP